MIPVESFPGKCTREIGSVLNVELKSLSFPLSHPATDQSIAAIATGIEDLRNSTATKNNL